MPRSLLGTWLIALALSLPVLPLGPAAAESVLDQIARTGVLKAGTRDDARPFAFRDAQGRLVGFSVDLIEEVRKAVARRLGHEVRIDYTVVTSGTRLEAVQSHQTDLVCETATMTWSRQQRVDFTLPIFRDGTRILTYRATITAHPDFGNMRIGTVEGAVTDEILRDRLPDIAVRTYPTMPAALNALQAGDVDGIANVGIVLRGLLPQATKRQGLVIVPRGEALGYETLACIVPQNDSQWLNFVNGVLRDLFRDIDAYRGGYVTIYDRWFGRDAEIDYPLDERTVQFFLSTLDWLD